MKLFTTTLMLLYSSSVMAEPQDWGSVQGWDIFEAEDSSYCAMVMSYEGQGSTNLSYAIETDNSVLIAITNYGWSTEKSKSYDISFEFDKYTYKIVATGLSATAPKGLGISFDAESGPTITSEFSGSSGLKILMSDQVVDDLSLKGTSEALVRVKTCLAKIKREAVAAAREKARLAHISDDPFAKANEPETETFDGRSAIPSKAEPVKMTNSGYISSSDYPQKALSARIGGKVDILLTVNEFGQVSKCKIVNSSGNIELDDETCKVAAKRMKFSAATDDSGKAIEGTILRSINWRPPPPEPPPPPPPPKLEIER